MTLCIWVFAIFICVLASSYGNNRLAGIKVKTAPAPVKTIEEACAPAQVELVVSPRLSRHTSRQIQVSWLVPDFQESDMIGLYLTDPAANQSAPVFTVRPDSGDGWSSTPFNETFLDHTDTFKPVCLGYWAVYWRAHLKLAWTCLQTQPSWMSDHRASLGRFRLPELFIPGTHDSVAYSVTYQPRYETRYEKYVYTQEESVLSQLIYGVRYLDVRVGYHPGEGDFFSHHGIAKLRQFQGVIDDIIMFLNNSKDIVIMDLHHFPVGFKNQGVHLKFVDYLERELSSYAVDPSLGWFATLEDIWSTGRRLVMSYNNRAVVNQRLHLLWSPVMQKWGDKRTIPALQEYISGLVMRPPAGLWAAMAEVTPNEWDVLLDSPGGLRALAAAAAPGLGRWMRAAGRNCSVVALDFFRATPLVRVALDWNLRRAVGFCAHFGVVRR